MFFPKVAEELSKHLNGPDVLIKDTACGVTHQLPLFVGDVKGHHTHMCDVDLLIVASHRVRVIVEIEESGFLPTKICGKFLQSALATHFIHNSQEEHKLQYDEKVLFVQVLDGSKLKQRGHKVEQGKLIEKKIQSIIPLNGSCVTHYSLIFVNVKGNDNLSSVGKKVQQFLNGLL